jgi:hypothetical protein
MLPAGRNKFYHALYVYERRSANQEYADMVTALKSWRLECPHITVAPPSSTFLVCGVCSYLRMQIDMCPRSDKILLDALTERAGQHYAFQSAQRLCDLRDEEACKHSDGKDWHMHIDRMDQTTTIIPSIPSQVNSAWFREGRLKCSVIGAYWNGPIKSDYAIRTCFDDFKTGSNNQISAVLQNFHSAAVKEGNHR